ncbi:hypothetical protein M0805_005678 [Coniferiporia weirii]|nr:hypothetical protein M0805_005678 [Coniferiporia weirii]
MLTSLASFYFPPRGDDEYQFSQSRIVYVGTQDDESSTSATVMFFLLQILGGHIGVPIILLTLFVAKGVRRHPMLVNFLATWVIYSTSFCILLYLGKQFGPEPPKGICIFQASSIYGTAVLTAAAGLSFVLNLWFSLRDVSSNKSVVDHSSVRNYVLLAAPYVVFVAFLVLTAVFGSTSSPSLVSRNRYRFYCTIHLEIVDIVPALSALMMFAIIIFEVLIATKLYRLHKSFVHMKSNGGPPLHLVVRVGIFSVYSFLSIIACITFWSSSGDELPYIIQSSLPTAAALIFGTQRDLLETWGVIRFWHWIRRKPTMARVVEIHKSEPVLDSSIA